MSFERESQLDPNPSRTADPRFLIGGYFLGLVAMSPAPLAYYWLFAPVGALLVAVGSVLLGAVRPRFIDAALGALLAFVFGVVTVVAMLLVLGVSQGR